MDKYIMNRVIEEAKYTIETKSTVRDVANVYKVSKSTVHKDLKERLLHINIELYNKVAMIFDDHIKIRHIRGGEATKLKYLKR